MKTLLVLILTCASAPARIGETESRIEKRYGKPGPSALDCAKQRAREYHYRGFTITVVFENGVSSLETYEKGAPMTTGELAALLDANSGGAHWPMPERKGHESFFRTRNRVASYNALTGRFMVTTPEELLQMAARGAALDAVKMKGF